MTRAKDELRPHLGRRLRQRPPAQGVALRGRGPRPAVARARAAQEPGPGSAPPPPGGAGAAAGPRAAAARARDPQLSYRQVDDYETCPLKYRYVHVLRVPLLTHHGLVYGHAVHEAVRAMFEHRLAGKPFSEDDLVDGLQGVVGLRRLPVAHPRRAAPAGRGEARSGASFEEEAEAPWSPTAVEQDFAFYVDRNKVVGRYDLVLEEDGHVTVVDFKTGDVQTEKKAAARGRARACSSTCTPWPGSAPRAALPDRVELRFLESGLAAGRVPSRDDVEGAEARIRARPRRHPAARVPGPAHLRGLRPVPVPRDLPPHRQRARGRGLTSLTGDNARPLGLRRPAKCIGGKTVTAKAHLEPDRAALRGALKLEGAGRRDQGRPRPRRASSR